MKPRTRTQWGGGGGKGQSFRRREVVPRRLSNLWGSLSQVLSVPRQRGVICTPWSVHITNVHSKVYICNKSLQCRYRMGMGLGTWNTLTTCKRPVNKCTHFLRALNINFFWCRRPWNEAKQKTIVKSKVWGKKNPESLSGVGWRL